ncbi:hypothetical protein [Sporosarcina obsidiansis]|uniref:hypothetical protein n=1 Tax=Sporosarcina obsidiansis TaxID=2660748 RepID=UPI00129B95F4|nr:hypothetical protein [Sporosarcina obsidiansis]
MTISRKDYLLQIAKLDKRLIKGSEEYAEISEKYIFMQDHDISAMKEEWFSKVEDFKKIQQDINRLEIPNAFESMGKELRDAYKRYIDCVEEKTIKFSMETMNNGELDIIQDKERQAAEDIESITETLLGE